MLVRYGAYLLPSVLAHCAFFAALASSPSSVESLSQIAAVEFTVISDLGGGRLGNDTEIGDATAPAEPPQQKFREVRPQPNKPVARTVEPAKAPAPEPQPTVEGEGTVAQLDQAQSHAQPAVGHSRLSGSAGSDPAATAAGVGSGGEGVDRRSALRAWLREIQREVNKIATRNYPSAAVRMRLEGKLRLGVTIARDGRVLGVRVLSSSGHTVLDQSATHSVEALHIPAPPEELRWSEREIALPIRYALQ